MKFTLEFCHVIEMDFDSYKGTKKTLFAKKILYTPIFLAFFI